MEQRAEFGWLGGNQEVMSTERRLVVRLMERWQNVRGARHMPHPADFSPLVFGKDWNYCAFLKRDIETDHTIVVDIGSEFDPRRGLMVGRAIWDVPRGTLFAEAMPLLAEAIRLRVPVSRGGEAVLIQGLVRYRATALPLSSDDMAVDAFVLGANSIRVDGDAHG